VVDERAAKRGDRKGVGLLMQTRANRSIAFGIVLIVAGIAVWSGLSLPTVEAQRQDSLVRIVDNDRIMTSLLSAVQQQNKLLQALQGRLIPTRLTPTSSPVVLTNAWDPCLSAAKVNVAISQTATTKLVPGEAGQRIFVCALRVVAAAAEIPSFIEGLGSACATGTAAVSGSTTAANGESYAANGGFSSGDGIGTVMATNKAGDDLCLQQSGANRLSGNLVIVYGPHGQ
jgi:hypothetical protein